MEEPAEDPSDNELPPLIPREEDSDDEYDSGEDSDDEDEGVILTQPEVIPSPEITPVIPTQPLSEVDLKIQEVYGDYVRQNDGSHLNGGIRDDALWQARWKKIVSLPPQRYDVPNGKVGKLFIQALQSELHGIVDRKCNSEKFIVFASVILQRSPLVKKARDI